MIYNFNFKYLCIYIIIKVFKIPFKNYFKFKFKLNLLIQTTPFINYYGLFKYFKFELEK